MDRLRDIGRPWPGALRRPASSALGPPTDRQAIQWSWYDPKPGECSGNWRRHLGSDHGHSPTDSWLPDFTLYQGTSYTIDYPKSQRAAICVPARGRICLAALRPLAEARAMDGRITAVLPGPCVRSSV